MRLSDRRNLDLGISPIIAVILIVAITLILAGVVAIWVFSFLEDGNTDNPDRYIFQVSIDGAEDEMHLSFIKGDPLPTSIIKVYIDEQTVNIPLGRNITAGGDLVVDTPIDMQPGETYHIKIVVQNELQFDQDRIASS